MLHHYCIPESSASFTSKVTPEFYCTWCWSHSQLSVFLSRVNVLNCDSRKKKKITLLYHTILSGIVPRVVSGSPQGTDATIQCLGFSKHWCTAGVSFPCPLATSLPTNFPSKQTVHIQKKSHVWKGEHMSLMCDALIETRQHRRVAPFWRLGGLQGWEEIPDFQISFKGKIKLAPHTSLICMASFPIGITVFPTCNGPTGQRFTLVLGATRAILDPSSLASPHMAGLGKHLGIFVSPSR